MVPLKYQKNENLEKKYYKLITQSRNERFIEEIDEKCQCYLKMPFKNLVCASPDELEQLHSNVKDRTDYGQMKDAFKHISSIKQNNYIVSILFQNMPKEAKLLIYEQVGQNVCLYCNRNFIEDLKIVKNRNGRKPVGTFELDHFYSKDEFPMFAVSFYNLIPVCGTCNRIKSNTVFNINPYLMYDKKDNISFEYNILGSNYMENEDELEIRIKSSSKEALEDAQNLRLEEIYNRHKDIVQEIIKKMKYYNSEYIECLFKDTGALFQSKDELYRLLYGGYANPDEFGKRPLSKFIKDIYQNTKEVLDGFDIFSDIDT